jgi:hypothetical protein
MSALYSRTRFPQLLKTNNVDRNIMMDPLAKEYTPTTWSRLHKKKILATMSMTFAFAVHVAVLGPERWEVDNNGMTGPFSATDMLR